MTNHNNKLVYCIECERMVELEHGTCGELHAFANMTEYGWDYGWCEFPYGYTTCPPPELEVDWEEHLVEPEPEFFMEVE